LLKDIRVKFGIIDYHLQAKQLTENYFKLTAANSKASEQNEVMNLQRNLEEKGGDFISLQATIAVSRESYGALLKAYDAAVEKANKKVSYTEVISSSADGSPDYPRVWFSLLIFTGSALLLSLAYITLVQQVKP
jgi:uncharacterized protein involved in exopolysaccharide biosynthesis